MQDDLNLPPELAELEQSLSRLEPTPSGASRGRLLYLAGRASAGRSRVAGGWMWPAATAAACCVAIVAVGLAVLAPTRVQERIVYVDRPVAAPPSAAETPSQIAADDSPEFTPPVWPVAYLNLRSALAAEGLEALPEAERPSRSAADPPRYTRMTDGLLAFQSTSDAEADSSLFPWSWARFVSPQLREQNP